MRKLYKMGPLQLDPDAQVLTHEGAAVALGARGVAVLAALVSRANEYVQKSAILDAAWPGMVVEEANLAVQVSAIRRALARVPGGEGWIETLARRGYRFVGPVTEIAGRSAPRAATDWKRTNLPELLTSFVGRERELAEIKQLLPATRLLTLTGTGGMGKTRLAQQAATEVLDAYRNGVWFVDLAPLRDPVLVPSALAQVLQVKESAGQQLLGALCNHLRQRETLLILDNCEHVLDACARLAEALLRETARATVMATSREPLHLAAEHTYPLAALPLPDPNAGAQSIARCDAVQLFLERARQYRPRLDLQGKRARAVAEICVRLDGIPLALELAAARIAMLPVEQILRLLDQRFRLLTSGNRELPRHQTLSAMIDWSHELLDDAEKALFARLSVFAGGWTLAAAEAIGVGEPITKDEVVYVLIGLIEQSLVVANEDGDRYRLLETVRVYALEKLVEAGETDAIARRHAQCLLDRFERAPEDWLRLPDKDWRRTYAPELDNVRAALDWAVKPEGDSAIGVALAAASGPLWMELSLPVEGLRRLQDAVAQIGTQTPELHQARLWLCLGMLVGEADPARSMAATEQACELYRRLGDEMGRGFSLVIFGSILTKMGRFELATAAFTEAFLLLEHAGVPKALARYFECFGFLKMQTGDLVAARANYEDALLLYRRTGAAREVPQLGNIADLDWALGDLAASAAGFREEVAVLRKAPVSANATLGFTLCCLSGVLTEGGQLDEALVAAREGLPLLNEVGLGWYHLDHLALLATLTGKPKRAARLAGYADSVFAAKELRRQSNEARARDRLQSLLYEEFGPDELERLLADGASMSESDAFRLAVEE
jgi:predicted ATPase/DNA-binding winged helix-turn-helix (wHTH) protein